jgi:molecular chaperone GrpE
MDGAAWVARTLFGGDREEIRQRAAQAALDMVRRMLLFPSDRGGAGARGPAPGRRPAFAARELPGRPPRAHLSRTSRRADAPPAADHRTGHTGHHIMASRHERPFDDGGAARGEPGSDDAYARGASADGSVADDGVAGEFSDAPAATGDAERQRTLEEQRDKYLRLAAEYDNYRRRTVKERQEAAWRGQSDMVKGMLDALDDLGRFAHVDPSTVEAAAVVQGAEMVEKKLLKTLAGHGLEIVNPVDHPFDPALHEAVATEPAASSEDDHMVARVFQPGYIFNGQLLRPARVVVKQWNG